MDRLIALLGECSGDAEELRGGITNRNYRVRLGGADYVVRVTSPESSLLGMTAAVSMPRRRSRPGWTWDHGWRRSWRTRGAWSLITLPGVPLPPEELRDPVRLAEVARTIRAVHDGAPFPTTFDAFEVVESYANRPRTRRGAAAGLRPGAARRGRDQGRAARCGATPVPCHNDLLNANFILDARGVRIVDWEYAGMGDRYFDLGNLSINNGLRDEDDERLLTAYFDAPCTDRRLACLRLMRIMSDFREAMWGVVQGAVSTLDFDYAQYAARHFARLEESAADARYSTWLRQARAG